ncbi:MAG: hypothetical protein GFH27_549323n42 [Chloroflexi bacterium AL-W]|nr:hypothetical protein [Chloroflexi bacterium AL-N1]NOK70193.1 hypothetical protein [Chloroflexi bacterium AL-N10]NOK77730.1 hypothetical protein [Chloroflexi bacterium AL-N5]NOK84739.1 hypothetical protein [Chloroflexi bacterium AL-W]NOK93198.1 hypothetical protein [Chloroflexi bacterium AL-N15]
MLRTLIDKIYQPTTMDTQRLLLLRIGLIGFLIILASSLTQHHVAQIANAGTVIIMSGIVLFILARSLPQDRQPLIGHLVMGGLLASVVGLIIMLAGRAFFILTT